MAASMTMLAGDGQRLETAAAADATGVCATALTKDYPVPRSFFAWAGPRRTLRAVDQVSLRMHAGEVFGLVGPNGAGKTTLIKMLTTLLIPTSGHAVIAGHDSVRSGSRVRRLVGLITSNERSFYWRLTGRQNLEFFARLYRLPRREFRPWIAELLDLVGLSAAGDQRFDGYSTGMKQRLALARGLLHRPRFLFMDEPTKGVDPLGAAEIVQLIRGRIIESWKPTILITSHNLSEVERLCGRIALMARGRIVSCGRMEELRRLVRPAAVYRLLVSGLTPVTLTQLASRAGAAEPVVRPADHLSELEAAFPQESDGFARLISAIVTAGGQVRHCTSVQESLDDVFQKLVRGAAEPAADPARGPA